MQKLKDLLANLQLQLLQFLDSLKGKPQAPVPVPAPSLYNWLTPSAARKSVRMICDEVGLTVDQKNLICQVLSCESGFKNNAKNQNIVNGKVSSTDWGICQINDYFHIGVGKDFPSVDYVLTNPEMCIRWMIKMYQAGKLTMWVCYQKGMYKNYFA